LKSDVFVRRATGKLAELANHMRLVKVATIVRKFDPTRWVALADPLYCSLEPQNPPKTPGRCTQLITELGNQMLMAPAELSSQDTDLESSTRLLQAPPGPLNSASRLFRRRYPLADQTVDQVKPPVPIAGFGERFDNAR
jgi:hypothetical protein